MAGIYDNTRPRDDTRETGDRKPLGTFAAGARAATPGEGYRREFTPSIAVAP